MWYQFPQQTTPSKRWHPRPGTVSRSVPKSLPRNSCLPSISPHSSCIIREDGFIFITTLLLLTLLVPLSLTAIARLQTDLHIARNLLSSIQALWIARAGTAVGKDWLERNLPSTTLPVTIGPRSFANGQYTVTIDRLDTGNYRVSAIGEGSNASRHVVEEIIHIPRFPAVGAVISDGDGLQPDFDDDSGGTGRRIPDFSIDGRNHALNGAPSSTCPAVSPFATTQLGAQGDLLTALNRLKREIVQRANSFCQADAGNAAGTCTPGLFWVRGGGVTPRFMSGACDTTDPSCFLNLDLSAPTLRATAFPPELHGPTAPDNRGPFGPRAAPFVQSLSSTQRAHLRDALLDIVRRLPTLPTEKVVYVRSDMNGGTHAFGTLHQPKVTWIEEGRDPLDIDARAIVQGAGVLIISRSVRLKNATFNWQGLVFMVNNGALQVDDPDACGQISGAVVIRDNAISNRKFDLDRVERNGRCSPFAVNYSCEAINRALSLFMRSVAWTEQFNE